MFVDRDQQGHIVALYANPQFDGHEWVADAAIWTPPSDPKDAIRTQIKQLEAEQLMPRATREFMLLFMETSFTPAQLAANPGYQAVKAFDDQIKALRAQL